MEKTTLYFALDADREIAVTIETRVYNGIASDPRVITREPTITEVFALVGKINFRSLHSTPLRPTLDYPPA